MKVSIALLSFLIAGIGFSQQMDSVKTKNSRFVIKMTHGMINGNEFEFTNSEWQRMTPGFDIPDSLKVHPYGDDFNYNLHTTSANQYYMFSFSLINGANKQAGRRFMATTSFHLGYGPELVAEKHWYHEDRQVIDTLTSSQNGQEFYIYGNRNQTIAKRYRSKSIVFGIGEHIATNPERIFQFETGLDVLCVLSIASEVRASYTDNYQLEGIPLDQSGGGGSSYLQPALNDPRAESFSGYMTAGLIVRVPLEMSFKLSKKNPVLSRMRIGGELNPGLGVQFTKGKTSNGFSFSGGMNFRFLF